jgi:hypothetical protein
MKRTDYTRILLLLPLLAAVGACQRSSGPPRYPLVGEVFYDGQPVAAGAAVFEPDAARGNTGPAVTVAVAAGRFATDRGAGTIGGPHLVRLTGYDGQPPAGEAEWKPLGELVFGPYVTNVDLPKAATTLRLDVPAQPAAR